MVSFERMLFGSIVTLIFRKEGGNALCMERARNNLDIYITLGSATTK